MSDNGDEDNENAQYFYGDVYDLTAEESEEPYAVCTALNVMQTEGSSSSWKQNVKQKNMYNSEGSGRFYDYSASNANQAAGSGTGGKIAATLIGILVVAGLAFFAYKKYSKKQDSRKEPLVSEGLA